MNIHYEVDKQEIKKMKIAIVDKCPSNTNYETLLNLSNLEVFHLSSQKVSRLLKRDVDLEFDPSEFDWVILVGSEAVKMYSGATNVSDYTGKILPDKSNSPSNMIACISPGVLAFKPEHRPVFEETVKNIHKIIAGNGDTERKVRIVGIRDSREAEEYLKMVATMTTGTVALDSETSDLSPRKGHILGISISYSVDEGAYIDADCLSDKAIETLQRIINTRPVVFHNAKFDMKFFDYHLNISFEQADLHDTMIQHYLLDERQGTHGLKSLTMKYGTLGDYDRELDEFKKSYCKSHGVKAADFSYANIPFDIMLPYAAKDTIATLELFNKFYPIIKNNPKLYSCYTTLMIPALHFLNRIESRGVPVSIPRLKEAKKVLLQEIEENNTELYSFKEVAALETEQGSRFNPNSTVQIRKLLFDHLRLPIPDKLTGTGQISTDAEVMKNLAELHRVPALILAIKQNTKLISTYIDKLVLHSDLDSRVRTGFNLTSTTSGRLSSSGNFNMQQLPRDNPIIKGCVKARPGYKIVACDLTTAEVYYAAALSGDTALQKVFINMAKDPDKYPDFHSNIAHMVFNLPCEPAEVKKLYPALRQGAKAITFGILYGSGPAKVAESVNAALIEAGEKPTCSKEDAQGYIKTYFARFKRLKAWIDDCHNQIKSNGFIYNHFGRKRRLHNINSADRGVAAGEVRSGFNAIIQSVSSDHLLLGAIDADLEIMEKGIDASIFALVHDSVAAEVREDQVEEYFEILTRNIQKDRGCSIPGAPIGLDQETEEGGSTDYSGSKFYKTYPELAKL